MVADSEGTETEETSPAGEPPNKSKLIKIERQQTYPTSHNKVQFADDNNPNSPLLKDNNESKSLELPSSNGILHSVESCNTVSPRKKKRSRTLSESSYLSGTSFMSSSSSSLSNAGGEPYSFKAPDGGWGWVIVIASFMINMIADGVTFSFGVIFDELQKEFKQSKAITAGVVSLFHAVPLLSGPVASALTDRYGCRKVTIFGAILSCIGFLLSAVAPNLEVLYITYGLISGFGLSLCYVAAVVIVAYYFDQKRSFATGISVCGSGVGTFVFAPLTQYLIQEYNGWRGASVILAGIFLNMVICGALFRDLEWTKSLRDNHNHRSNTRKNDKLRRKTSSNSNRSCEQLSKSSLSSSPSRSSMPDIDKLACIEESLFSQEEFKQNPRLSSSLVNLPTYLNSEEPPSDEIMHVLIQNKAAHTLILERFPNSRLAIKLRGSLPSMENNLNPEQSKQQTEEEFEIEPNSNVVKLKRKVSSLFKTKPALRPILKKPKSWPASSNHQQTNHKTNININFEESEKLKLTQNQSAPQHQLQQDAKPASKYLHHLKVKRQSLTYRGAMLNIPKYRLRDLYYRASSCPDIYWNSMVTIDVEVEDESWCQKFTKGLFDCCLGWKNCMNPAYIIFALSNFILYAWYDVMYVYLYDYAESDLKFKSSNATLLLSMIGILNTIGEVLVGWLGDQSWMNLNALYAFCMLICGISTALVPFLTDLTGLGILAGLFGFFISANYSLTSPILVNHVSLEQFSSAYGLLLLVQGISNLLGPPFAGFLYDKYKIWHYTFGLGGMSIFISGVLLLILPCFRQAKLLHYQRKQTHNQDLRNNVEV